MAKKVEEDVGIEPRLLKLGSNVIKDQIMRRGILFSAAMLFPLVAFATWTGMGDVTQVYSHDGYHFIQTNIAEDACGTNGKFFWPTSDSDAKDMLAISLAALAADKDIRVGGEFVSPSVPPRWRTDRLYDDRQMTRNCGYLSDRYRQ